MTDPTATWLSTWNEQSLSDLTERLRRLGATEPMSWASSELRENIAQTTRFLMLRGLWRRMDEATAAALIAVEGVRERDGDGTEMRAVLANAFFQFAFDVAYLLDEPEGRSHSTEPYADVAEDEPRWMLMEASPEGELTGRDVGGLHESLNER